MDPSPHRSPDRPTDHRAHPDPALDGLAARVRAALEQVEESRTAPEAGRLARQLLDEIADMTATRAGAHDDDKRRLWGALANARAEVKRLELHGVQAAPTIEPARRRELERLHTEREEAEARARNRTSSPRAFRAFVKARKAEAAALAAAGFATWDDVVAADDEPVDHDAELSAAQRRLQEAEAAWQRFERAPEAGLPDSPEADAVRARSYRLIGTVTDDGRLLSELERMSAEGERRAAAELLLASNLRQAGFDPAGDIILLARTWLRTVER